MVLRLDWASRYSASPAHLPTLTSFQAESYSALSTIKEDITEHKFLGYVERILEKVYARRCHMVDEIPPSSFKLPVRTTVNELRRTVWLNDLANSSIPLQKLGRSVPGGVKGHDLLDMLHTNNVTIPRAVWYIRVLGGNETVCGSYILSFCFPIPCSPVWYANEA
jgi:mediator of RNA polymerase II transcription subunit 12, fungi type